MLFTRIMQGSRRRFAGRKPAAAAWLVLALMAMSGITAGATTVAPMSFTELVNESAAVVYGRVTEVRGQWTDDRRSLESVVTLDVMSAFKGSPGSTIAFSVPGGQSGRFMQFMPGVPMFTRGDLIVVFLTARGVRLPGPTGLSQGVFRAAPEGPSGSIVVAPPVLSTSAKIVRGDPQRRRLTLAAFGDAVRAVHGARP